MKTPIHSPCSKAVVLLLACATATRAATVPSTFPFDADLQAPSSLASPLVASAGFQATFIRMKKEALLAKHNLLSEVNRVGFLEHRLPPAEGGLLTIQTATQAVFTPPSGITGRPAEPLAGQPSAPELPLNPLRRQCAAEIVPVMGFRVVEGGGDHGAGSDDAWRVVFMV